MNVRSKLLCALLLWGCATAQPKPTEPAAPPPPPAPAPAASAAPDQQHPVVVMSTSMGDITIELDRTKAPVTVDNFLRYVNEHFYDGTIFHRVINGFMIQGGGFTTSMQEKPTHEPIVNEGQNGLKNLRGTIAMARTQDLNSATAQFYINVVDNPALDYPSNGGYAVFGKVINGMDVVDQIKAVPTHRLPDGTADVPNYPIVIKSVQLKQ